MEQIDLTVRGVQHFVMPRGLHQLSPAFLRENQPSFDRLQQELEGPEPVEIRLTDEEGRELPGLPEDKKSQLIGELVGKIMESAHSMSPRTEFFTLGTLQTLPDGVALCYRESELTGMEGSQTAIRIGNDGLVSLNRTGRVATNLVFAHQKRIQCLFEEYGPRGLPVCLYTRSLKIWRRGSHGRLSMDYFIEVGGVKTEHNEFFVQWKPHKAAGGCIQ